MRQRFSTQLLSTLSSLPKLDAYCNSTVVVEIGGENLCPEDVLKASVAGGLPALLVSGTGDGKSLIATEIAAKWFAGRATLLRGDGGESPIKAFLRTDFKALFRREAGSDEALIEPTERVHYGLLFADELNRQLLTAMQGELLQLIDGKIVYRGREYQLGTQRGFYSVLAAMNVGAAYVATSQLDEALRQRFPVVLDLDRFAASVSDMARIQPINSATSQNWLSELECAWEELTAVRAVPTGLRLASAFVAQHLNRCSLLDQPKRTLTQAIPRLCAERGCPHMGRGCHYLDETPWRILLSLERVTIALQAVAAAKAARSNHRLSCSIEGDLNDYLTVLQTFGWPVSGVLAKQQDERSSHDYSIEIVGHVRESFENHAAAILDAVTGRRPVDANLGPWEVVVAALLNANPPTRRALPRAVS